MSRSTNVRSRHTHTKKTYIKKGQSSLTHPNLCRVLKNLTRLNFPACALDVYHTAQYITCQCIRLSGTISKNCTAMEWQVKCSPLSLSLPVADIFRATLSNSKLYWFLKIEFRELSNQNANNKEHVLPLTLGFCQQNVNTWKGLSNESAVILPIASLWNCVSS